MQGNPKNYLRNVTKKLRGAPGAIVLNMTNHRICSYIGDRSFHQYSKALFNCNPSRVGLGRVVGLQDLDRGEPPFRPH